MTDFMEKMHSQMLFIGYFMMMFCTLFIIIGKGDYLPNVLLLILMTFFAIEGIKLCELDKKYQEEMSTVEEIA